MKTPKYPNRKPNGPAGPTPEHCMRTLTHTTPTRALAAVLLIVLAQLTAMRAAEYAVNWWTTDGGGGTSASADGRFSMSGTIGQPDAGTMSGGPFTLSGGFWYSQTPPCDCRITCMPSPDGHSLVLNWPACCAGFVLEATDALGPDANWGTVACPPGATTCTTAIDRTTRFFRLRRP